MDHSRVSACAAALVLISTSRVARAQAPPPTEPPTAQPSPEPPAPPPSPEELAEIQKALGADARPAAHAPPAAAERAEPGRRARSRR